MSEESSQSLEELLAIAIQDNTKLEAFYQALLDATIYVIGDSMDGGDEDVALEEGSDISIESFEKADGTLVIPFFSSLELLQDSLEEGESYLGMQGAALLETTIGNHLVLNPNSPSSKEFTPEEVEAILALSGHFHHHHGEEGEDGESELILSQPTEAPTEIINVLSELFATNKSVSRAFYAEMVDPSVGEEAHLLIGIEASEGIEEVFELAGEVLSELDHDGRPIGLCEVREGDDSVSEYLLKTTPFYIKH